MSFCVQKAALSTNYKSKVKPKKCVGIGLLTGLLQKISFTNTDACILTTTSQNHI